MYSKVLFAKFAIVAGALEDPQFAESRQTFAEAASRLTLNLVTLGRDAESQNYVIDGDTRVPQGRWAVTNIADLIEDASNFFASWRDDVNQAYAALVEAGRVSAKDREAIRELRGSTDLDAVEAEAVLTRLIEVVNFFQLSGLDDMDNRFGRELEYYMDGNNGKAFMYLLRSEHDRKEDGDDFKPFTLGEAFQAVFDEGGKFREFLNSWREEIDEFYAKMRRMKEESQEADEADDSDIRD